MWWNIYFFLVILYPGICVEKKSYKWRIHGRRVISEEPKSSPFFLVFSSVVIHDIKGNSQGMFFIPEKKNSLGNNFASFESDRTKLLLLSNLLHKRVHMFLLLKFYSFLLYFSRTWYPIEENLKKYISYKLRHCYRLQNRQKQKILLRNKYC